MNQKFYIFRAWLVHFYTGLAIPISFFSLIAITKGQIQLAFFLNILNVAIDSTDGTLARKFEVKRWLPNFNGAELDDISDFFTFVLIPIFIAYHCNMVPETYQFCLAFPLMASGYGFCQAQAKTEDGFFTGFPSYWNIIVFYLYLFESPPFLNLVLLMVLSFLVFVPFKYLYPSRAKHGRFWLISLGILWAISLVYFIYLMEETPKSYLYLSLLYPAYYMIFSIILSLKKS